MLDISDSGDIRILAVTGDVPMSAARALVIDAIVAARESGIRRLAIDITAATALGAPHVGTRLDIVREWADAALPGIAIAFIGPEALMDTQRVALTVARGLGMTIDVFTTRDAALDWLRTKAR